MSTLFSLNIAFANNNTISITSCEFSDVNNLFIDEMIANSSIPFVGDDENVYNAGVAAEIVNGFQLDPMQEFSFNNVVGNRTMKKGFIRGYDINNNLVVGGGVCRTSTVLFQAATSAQLDIIERHPHIPEVHYTPPGTDATVSWGTTDFRFLNNRPNPIIIKSGQLDETFSRRLWAELWERKPIKPVDVAINFGTPMKNIPKIVALIKDNVAYISLEQMANILNTRYTLRESNGILNAELPFKGQLMTLSEKSDKAVLNNNPIQFSGPVFRLNDCTCKLWLPLRDFSRLAGIDVQWNGGESPSLQLDLKTFTQPLN